MKTLLVILAFVSVLTGEMYSQVSLDWVRTYNGIGTTITDDIINAMVIDKYGNVYVTGQSGNTTFDYDIVTIKYNSTGTQQWLARYHNPGGAITGAEASAIAVDSSGNVFVCGKTQIEFNASDIIVLKYDSLGNQQWAHIIDGGGVDYATSIAADLAGNSYLTGVLSGTFISDLVVIKYNPSGASQWTRTFDLNGFDNVGSSLVLNNSGNIIVTGYGSTGNHFNTVTIEYNSNGDSLWTRIFSNGHSPAFGDTYGNKVAVDGSGNVFVGGSSGDSLTGTDYMTLKYSSTGSLLWNNYYHGNGLGDDAISDIKADYLGNLYITGTSINSNSNSDYATIKYNASGGTVWVNRYNGTGASNDIATAIALDLYGNAYVTGSSIFTASFPDIVTVKYDSSGVQKWVINYNGSSNGTDQGRAVSVDLSGDVYVAGFSQGVGTGDDYTTIKYSQPIGIKQISNEIPKSYKLSQNYPNPFNPSTNIKFDVPKQSFVKLVVFDILGREVTKLVNEELKAGSYNVDWNAPSYSSGVYFYRLETEGFAETKKMVLLK